MAGSPVACFRRLQTAVLRSTGRAVSSIALISGLIEEFEEANFIRFSKVSLHCYLLKLRNWQIADQVIYEALQNKKALQQRERREEKYSLKAFYVDYVERATKAGLKPLAYPTFKSRASDFPSVDRHLLVRCGGYGVKMDVQGGERNPVLGLEREKNPVLRLGAIQGAKGEWG